ncbi:protein NLRC3-like [Pholidichthys leucotaenia]
MDLPDHLKTTLRNRYQHLNEEFSLLPPRLCFRNFKQDNILRDLKQHEFRYVDKSYLPKWSPFKTVPLSDILSCDCEHDCSKRTVITLGVSGVGKTTTVQTCALEWAEERAYHNIHFMFPLTFWELNLLKDELSLVELLQIFYPELKELDASSLNEDGVWLVLDGLDEYNSQLSFDCPAVSDVSEASTVDVLVTNLIRGTLLPKSHIWITTRYSAATQIPDVHILKETEIQGFNDEQKMEYFSTTIGDDDLANKAMDHVRMSRSLDFLCQIPPICAMMAKTLKDHLQGKGLVIDPLSLTQIYICYLSPTEASNTFAKLKKLAQHRMGKGNVMSEDELLQSDISALEASAFSKAFPFVLREEMGLSNTTVFRFGHSSIEEFLAACSELDTMKALKKSVSDCCKELVVKAICSPEGKFDIFLRFIFGLIKEHCLEISHSILLWLKMTILANIRSLTGSRLIHCYREYDSCALMDVYKSSQQYVSPAIRGSSHEDWKWMIGLLRVSEGMRDNFELVGESSEEKFLRELPFLLRSKKAM